MKKSLLVLGMAAVLSLTGCHGLKKVKFAEFKEKVEEVSKDIKEVKSVKFSGKIEDKKFDTFTISEDNAESELSKLDDTQVSVVLVFGLIGHVSVLTADYAIIYDAMGEEGLKDLNFYIGFGFKIKSSKDAEGGKGKMEFDKNGFMTLLQTESNGKKSSVRFKVTLK